MLTWIDLCSGLGGSSQPALDRGWKVIRLDIEPKFKPDIIVDLLQGLPLKQLKPTIVWASPPCTEFSKTRFPKTWKSVQLYPPKPDTALTAACYEAIKWLQPRYWVIENVLGSRPYLNPLLGQPKVTVRGHAFWGKFPGELVQTEGHKNLPDSKGRAARRSKVPYEIGLALCRAIETEMELYGLY